MSALYQVNNSSNYREYSEDIVNKIIQMAQNQATPTQICTYLELHGIDRVHLIEDLTSVKHPLASKYYEAFKIGQDDVTATVQLLSLKGDTDAMEVAIKQRDIDYIIELKFKLFGI